MLEGFSLCLKDSALYKPKKSKKIGQKKVFKTAPFGYVSNTFYYLLIKKLASIYYRIIYLIYTNRSFADKPPFKGVLGGKFT